MSRVAQKHAIPETPDGVWIADLVAWLWEQLHGDGECWRLAYDEGYAPPTDDERLEQFLGSDGLRWRNLARSGEGLAPEPLLAELDHALSSSTSSGAKGRAIVLLRMLVAVDRAYAGLSVLNPRHTSIHQRLLEHLDGAGNGNLARAARETVVLRKGNSVVPGGQALAHYLESFAPLSSAARGGHVVVAREPIPARLSDRPNATSGELEVAFVPILDEHDDVTFSPLDLPLADRFVAVLDDAKQRKLEAWMPRLVARLEAEGVNVVLFPETCIDAAVVRALSDALNANFRACARRGRGYNYY